MKKLLLLIVALGGLAWGAVECARRAVPVFLVDMIAVHGPAITRTAMAVKDAALDPEVRAVRYAELHVEGARDFPAATAALDAATLELHLPADFKPDVGRLSLLPDMQVVDSVVMDGLTLQYDIESEGGNLRQLRTAISEAAAEGMRQRLNARNRPDDTAPAPQRVVVNTLTLSKIQVRARSLDRPDRQKTFLVSEIRLRDIGKASDGVTWPEVVDVASRRLMDDIQREALLQGVIEPPRPQAVAAPRDTARRGASRSGGATDTQDAGAGDTQGNGNGTIKDIGRGVKKIGQEFGKGLQRVFGKEE